MIDGQPVTKETMMKTTTKTNDAVAKAAAKHDAAVAKVTAAGEAHAKAVAALKAAIKAEAEAAAAEREAAVEATKAFKAWQAAEVDIDFSRAVRSYTGKANCCRCGCAGNYSESKAGVTRQINRIKSLIAEGIGEVTIDEDYVDVDCGDKVYTVYFS